MFIIGEVQYNTIWAIPQYLSAWFMAVHFRPFAGAVETQFIFPCDEANMTNAITFLFKLNDASKGAPTIISYWKLSLCNLYIYIWICDIRNLHTYIYVNYIYIYIHWKLYKHNWNLAKVQEISNIGPPLKPVIKNPASYEHESRITS